MNEQTFQEQKLIMEALPLARKAIINTVECLTSCLYNSNAEISSKKIIQFQESLTQLLESEQKKNDVSLIQIEQDANGTRIGRNTLKGFAELLGELSMKPEHFLPMSLEKNLCLDVRTNYEEGRCSRGCNYQI